MNMKNLLNAIVKKLTPATKKPVVKISYEEMLHTMPEEAVIGQVRHTLKLARDFYAKRGRKILAVDLQTHLDFFNEAIGFDVLEKSPVLLPVNRDAN